MKTETQGMRSEDNINQSKTTNNKKELLSPKAGALSVLSYTPFYFD
jgi:hypothetical protein